MAAAIFPLVSLGIELAGQLIPLIKGAVVSIKQNTSAQGVVTYTVVITADQAEVISISQQSLADIVAINLEFAQQGVAPLDVPSTPTP